MSSKEIRCVVPLKDHNGKVIGTAEISKPGLPGMIYASITDGLPGVYRPEKNLGISIGPFDIATVDGLDKDSGHAGFEAWKKANKSAVAISPIEITRTEINEATRKRLIDTARSQDMNNSSFALDYLLSAIRGFDNSNVELDDLYQANQNYIRDLMKEEDNG